MVASVSERAMLMDPGMLRTAGNILRMTYPPPGKPRQTPGYALDNQMSAYFGNLRGDFEDNGRIDGSLMLNTFHLHEPRLRQMVSDPWEFVKFDRMMFMKGYQEDRNDDGLVNGSHIFRSINNATQMIQRHGPQQAAMWALRPFQA